MIVGFLREFAEVESFVGNASGAQALNELADQVATSVNDLLWSAPGVGLGTNDHYVTQLNPDNTTRDFVDYDGACEVCFKANLDVDVESNRAMNVLVAANLIAVAHGIPDKARAAAVLKRVDQVKQAQWCVCFLTWMSCKRSPPPYARAGTLLSGNRGRPTVRFRALLRAR